MAKRDTSRLVKNISAAKVEYSPRILEECIRISNLPGELFSQFFGGYIWVASLDEVVALRDKLTEAIEAARISG